MKLLTKVLLFAALIMGAGHTYAKPADQTQDRHLSGFNAVDVAGSFDVYIVQGSSESVKVEAPTEVINKIVTEVEGGTLKIHDKHNSGWNWGNWFSSGHHKVAVYVTVKDIHEIGVTGSGDAFFKDGIHADNLRIRVSGSGDVWGKVEAKTLDCSISGSGDMKLSGRAESQNVSVSGSGDYEARGLATVNTVVHVSGSGDASINASSNIDASVSGSGDISYTGGAQHVMKSKSGSGDIDGH
jgi:hypothetical protein